MSGIAAIIRFDGGSVEPGRVESITKQMQYRGPDGVSHWHSGPVALGHCMFRTTEESLSETQPLSNEDESIILILDGWLSNWNELRQELQSVGARLRTRSDAELVLRAYETWGKDCLRHLDGEFAFLIWDNRRREAFCARDHLGLRPLHYHYDGRQLIVASDIAGILAVPDVRRELNHGVMAEFLAAEWFDHDETLWQDVLRLKQAHWMRFGQSGSSVEQYWTPPLGPDPLYQKDEDYIVHYRELFADCVRRASRTHLPVGCEVSGGLDSSPIFSVAHHLLKRGELTAPAVLGYTLKFDRGHSDADEIAFARAVGEHVIAPIREVPPFFPDLGWFRARGQLDLDMPPYPNGATLLGVADDAVSDGCRVILNGSGGDEWLVGSHEYYADQLAAWDWARLVRSLREDVSDAGIRQTARWLARSGIVPLLPDPAHAFLRRIKRKVQPQVEDALPWLSPELRKLHQDRRTAFDRSSSPKGANFGQRRLLDMLHFPYGSIGRDQGSRLCARAQFESRSPMHARQFIEFALATPERLRTHATTQKYIHTRALADILPPVVAKRQSKADFGITFTRQLDQMSTFFLHETDWLDDEVFNKEGLSKLYQTRYLLESRHGLPMWQLWNVFGCATLMELVADADRQNSKGFEE